MNIADIKIGKRYRQDMGDIETLAQSIREIGLLHPIVVNSDGMLIAGRRRVEACSLLGWTEIPATVLDLESIIKGEHDENVYRKNFTPSEAVAVAEELEPMERMAAKERYDLTRPGVGVKFTPTQKGKSLDRVAEAVGMSRPTLTKAREVVASGDEELIEEMDRTGNISGTHKKLRAQEKCETREAKRTDLPLIGDRYQLICGDADALMLDLSGQSVDAIITDPPYSQEYLPLYESLACGAKWVLKSGGSLLAMAGQSYLPDIFALMTPHLTYNWTVAYLTPGGQSAQLWQRKVNTFWKPVLWFIKGEYNGNWIGDVAKSDVNENDKRFHDWGQSESGMADLIERFTLPGQTILDPFCGGGTTGVVALAMDRCFIGIDIDPEAIETTRRRIAELINDQG